jgi:hypothetical protein
VPGVLLLAVTGTSMAVSACVIGLAVIALASIRTLAVRAAKEPAES